MISKTQWERLTPFNRWRVKCSLLQTYVSADLRRLTSSPAFCFGMRAGLMTFALLFVLPQHPSSMVIALGGGVAVILIDESVKWLIHAHQNKASSWLA